MMARYNQWANGRLYAAAGQIATEALAEDRGAFFGSLLGTLNHLLVTDRLWMARLEGESPRGTRLDEVLHHRFDDLLAARRAQDQKLIDYVHGLSEERLAAPSTTLRAAARRSRSRSTTCSPTCSTTRPITAGRRTTSSGWPSGARRRPFSTCSPTSAPQRPRPRRRIPGMAPYGRRKSGGPDRPPRTAP